MSYKVVAVEDLDPSWIDYVVGSQICKRSAHLQWGPGGSSVQIRFEQGDGTTKQFSPGSLWSDAGPLLEDHRISLTFNDPNWTASVEGGESYTHFFPLRAAMMALIASKITNGCFIPTYA